MLIQRYYLCWLTQISSTALILFLFDIAFASLLCSNIIFITFTPVSLQNSTLNANTMLSGLQLPGASSYASRLRGEAPPYKSSRTGNSPTPKTTNAFQNKHTNLQIPSSTGKYVPSTPSNLGMYSQAHTRTPPSDDLWKDGPTKEGRTHSKEEPKPKTDGRIVDSMASLSITLTRKAEPVPKGRCLDWERPVFTSSTNSKVSKNLPRTHRDYLKPTPSAYSISYKRRNNQTPMEQATYREYLPFLRTEFKVGMIIRANIHESDFKGTSKAEILQASQVSTLVDGGQGDRRRKEHRHHGDFGPIYSENRIFIVVNVGEDVYTAIPLFTHEGKGLANIQDKNSWVSVEDHRQLGKCI